MAVPVTTLNVLELYSGIGGMHYALKGKQLPQEICKTLFQNYLIGLGDLSICFVMTKMCSVLMLFRTMKGHKLICFMVGGVMNNLCDT